MSAGCMEDLARQLVRALQPDIGDHPAELETAARRTVGRIKADRNGGTRKEWMDVRGTLQGFSRTARIRVEDDVADAYDKLIGKLADHRRRGGSLWDETMPLQTSNIPQHVQLLIELSQPTTERAHEFAEGYLARLAVPPKSDMRLFQEIMAEPFEGDHWGEGYDDEVYEGWTESDDDSYSSLTPSEDEIVTPAPSKGALRPRESAREIEARQRKEEEQRLLMAKLSLREHSANAYWKTGGEAVPLRDDLQGWRALSSVPAMASPALKDSPPTTSISASQLQRELLFAISGRPGVMFSFGADGTCSILERHPTVASFSPQALEGILTFFAKRASQAAGLRAFISSVQTPCAKVVSPSGAAKHSETREAFAEACRVIMSGLLSWVAGLEAEFMGAPSTSAKPISTPLMLQFELSKRFGDVLDSLCDFVPYADSANDLLNTIYGAVSAPTALAMRPVLIDIFIKTATPMWRLLGEWLVGGMPVPASLLARDADLALLESDDERRLLPEFFIQRDFDSSWSDEDFWEAGFVIGTEGWPAWLAGANEVIMEGGKARGLLRSLATFGQEEEQWQSLDQIINVDDPGDIAQSLIEYLSPICASSHELLHKVLGWDCDLQQHLDAIDALTLMKDNAVMDDWAEWLFMQSRSGQPWADFQLLTQSIQDMIESHEADWMNPACIRIRTERRGPRATLSDIRLTYMVPFPLSQLFSPTTIDLRSDVFTFLLRLLQARKLLLTARMMADARVGSGVNVPQLGRLRHGLAWVLDTLWIWINNALEIQSNRHKQKLTSGSPSFNDLIQLELAHVRRLRRFCFLHDDGASTFQALEHLVGLAEDIYAASIAAASAAPSTVPPRPPRRRRKKQRKGIFDASDSDENDLSVSRVERAQGATSFTVRPLNRVRDDLNSQVRRLRRGVDQMCGQGGVEGAEEREMWRMLTFAMGDWKEPWQWD